jgi:arylsulfatase A-like enzyme
MAAAVLGFAIALAPARTEAAAPVPRLVVLIVIDQFRYDYLQRYRDRFIDGGFKRLLQEGAAFTDAHYRHATTDTCPGHAVISTGTWGYQNGIVSNRWVDGTLGKTVECSDSTWRGRAGNLLRPTLGDVLKERTGGRSKVIAVSGKRAAAVLLGGQAADAAYWWNDGGRMVTSGGGTHPLPAWVTNYNDSEPSKAWFGRRWEKLLPQEAYTEEGVADSGGTAAEGLGALFPQPIQDGPSGTAADFHAAFTISPFADEVLVSFSMTAVREEKLGRDRVTDLLAISLSSNDRVGHHYGPDSPEMLDTIVRTDRLLVRLLDFLDREVGLDRTLLVLTADHGVAPLPEVSEMRHGGPAAARVPELELAGAVNDALNAACGQPESGEWVVFHDFPNLYLDESAMRSNGACGIEGERIARDAVADVAGVKSAFTRKQLTEWRGNFVLAEPVRMALRSFRPDRSGHVVYQLSRLHVAADTGTNHGSHWDYDTHVPLLWLGRGVKRGSYDVAVSPADIAPTLYSMLGITGSFETSGCALNVMLRSPPFAVRECRPEDW